MKYNSIGEQLVAKAKELDPSYKPDKFNDMSEALDVILNNSGEGGDIWLDISPYVNDETMTISQEGFDLVWNSFSNYTSSPINKYAGIDIDGSQKLFFDKAILSDIGGKQGLSFICKINIDGVEGCSFLNIYEDKSVEFDSKRFDSSLTLPTTSPSSQLFPSITTSNEQENLTIGNGLVIEDGALKTKEKIKIFQPTIDVQTINYDDESYSIEVAFNNNIFNEIKEYINSLISANKLFSTQLLVKSEKNTNYQFIANGSGSIFRLSGTQINISLLYDTTPGYFQSLALVSGTANSSSLFIQSSQTIYNGLKTLAATIFTNNMVIKVSVISYD